MKSSARMTCCVAQRAWSNDECETPSSTRGGAAWESTQRDALPGAADMSCCALARETKAMFRRGNDDYVLELEALRLVNGAEHNRGALLLMRAAPGPQQFELVQQVNRARAHLCIERRERFMRGAASVTPQTPNPWTP